MAITTRKKTDDKPAPRKSSALTVKTIIEQKLNEFGISLRDEFERQVFLANSELRTYILEERRASSRWRKIILALIVVITVLIGANIYLVLETTPSEAGLKEAVANEFSAFEKRRAAEAERQSQATQSILIPMKETVEQNLSKVSDQVAQSRNYINVYALEGLARSGSRSAFEELAGIVQKGGAKARVASGKIADIKAMYAVLREPKKINLTLGDVSIVRSGAVVSADVLSDIELLYVMNSPNATIPQVHHIMSLLWNKKPDYDIDNELLNVLQTSRNLPATVAVCSLLKNYYGQPYDIFDFGKWKTYLEKKIQ